MIDHRDLTRHVGEARQIVADQKDRIERLRKVGAHTVDAEHTLKVFEDNLRRLEENLQWLKRFGY